MRLAYGRAGSLGVSEARSARLRQGYGAPSQRGGEAPFRGVRRSAATTKGGGSERSEREPPLRSGSF